MSRLALDDRTATLSECGTYRYDLTRRWGAGEFALFVMLNPSTADAGQDDPTIRRCIAFARALGCGGVAVVNLFALRSTAPKALLSHADPVGPANEEQIRRWFQRDDVHVCVAAWGARCSTYGLQPGVDVEALAASSGRYLYALGLTKGGHPRHPLYVKADQPLVRFSPPETVPAHSEVLEAGGGRP